MIGTVVSVIGGFLFESVAAGIVGDASFAAVTQLYERRTRTTIETLYIKALKKAFDAYSPTLRLLAEKEPLIALDEKSLTKLVRTELDLDTATLASLTEGIVTRALITSIDSYLILSGHQLSQPELENIGRGFLRFAAEFFVKEITADESAFRKIVLQESRLAAYDRQTIIELLEELPVMLYTRIAELDAKMSEALVKLDKVMQLVTVKRLENLTIDDIRGSCASLTKQTLVTIPKYNAQLYVARKDVEWEFEQFMKSASPCFLVQGVAGSGKTNLICNLARKYSAEYPTLLLKGTTHIVGRLGLPNVIVDELAGSLGISDKGFEIFSSINTLMLNHNSQFLIFIDAINENRNLEQLAISLGRMIQDIVGIRIKICLSCRDIDWRFFEHEHNLMKFVYEPKLTKANVETGVYLELFDLYELEYAWEKYKQWYQIAGELTPALKEICKHPLMLQFLCEAFRGQLVPFSIGRREIFDRYWNEKIKRNGASSLENSLYTIVDHFWKSKTTEAYEQEILDLVGSEDYQALLSAQVVIYVFRDLAFDQNIVGFTYDAFFEYTLARHIRLKQRWTRASDVQIHENLRSLIMQADGFRSIQGAVEYLLLFSENPWLVYNTLDELSQGDIRWKLFCCDIQIKLGRAGLNTIPLIICLATDNNPQVRWASGYAIGYHYQATVEDRQFEQLRKLANSVDWRNREVGAIACGGIVVDLGFIFSLLYELSNDINWRVRRAVGYSLNRLCSTLGTNAFERVSQWLSAPEWRVRQAIAKSQKNLSSAPQQTINLLETLATDVNEEVRWLTVISLVSICWESSIRKQVLTLLMKFTADADYFVRKQLATLIPDLYSFVGTEAEAIAKILANDTDQEIRWELARMLGKIPANPFSSSLLQDLLQTDNQDVKFAALCSLNIVEPETAFYSVEIKSFPADSLLLLREQVARADQILQIPHEGSDILNTWKGDRYFSVVEALRAKASELDARSRVMDFVLSLIKDESEGIRWAVASAITALPFLTLEDEIGILNNLLADRHYWVRRETISTLNLLLPQITENQLLTIGAKVLSLLGDVNPEVRYAALICACNLGDLFPEAAERISICLGDPDVHVSTLAVNIMQQRRVR